MQISGIGDAYGKLVQWLIRDFSLTNTVT